MKTKAAPLLLLFGVVLLSIFITISPSFSPQGASHIQLKQELDLALVLDGKEDMELVFFGYAGCSDVCAPRLEALAKWYAALPKKMQARVGIKFLDLSVPQDKALPQTFATAFHENFTGVFLDEKILRLYSKAFSVYFAPSLMNEKEVDHSAHLYLIKRDKELKELRFIYTAYPYDFEQIYSDIKELIHE